MNTKHLISILLLIISPFALAQTQVYFFGKVEIEIWNFPERKISVSGLCIKNNQLGDCDALRGLKAISFKQIDRPKFGGANPGALICEQQLNGIVMVGIDRTSQNENSFCKLADDSVIDTGTLISYGIINDRNSREPNNEKKSKLQKKKASNKKMLGK